MGIKCKKCNGNNTRKASKLARIDGVYFCLDCAIYYPSKTLEKKLLKEKLN